MATASCGRACVWHTADAGRGPPSPAAAVEEDGREGATLEVDKRSIFDVRPFVKLGLEKRLRSYSIPVH